jgi:hypothetical protein
LYYYCIIIIPRNCVVNSRRPLVQRFETSSKSMTHRTVTPVNSEIQNSRWMSRAREASLILEQILLLSHCKRRFPCKSSPWQDGPCHSFTKCHGPAQCGDDLPNRTVNQIHCGQPGPCEPPERQCLAVGNVEICLKESALKRHDDSQYMVM